MVLSTASSGCQHLATKVGLSGNFGREGVALYDVGTRHTVRYQSVHAIPSCCTLIHVEFRKKEKVPSVIVYIKR